jgi:energy-coupling factor transport system permease protein
VAEASIDVRVRLLITLTTSIAVLVFNHPAALGIMCLAGAGYMGVLRQFKVQAICYVAMLLMSGLSVVMLCVMGRVVPMMQGSVSAQMWVPFLRMAAVMHPIMALGLSLPMQNMLAAMSTLRLPRTLYLPLAVTVRFIPGLIADLRQMRDCLRLRGYRGPAVLAPRLWLLPVVFRVLHLADELAVAAELKGIGQGPVARPQSRGSRGHRNTLAMILLVAVVAAAAWVDCRYHATTTGAATANAHRADACVRV